MGLTFEESLARVEAFIADMQKQGLHVIGTYLDGMNMKIVISLKPRDEEQSKGGDGDEKRTDAQS